MTDNDSIVCRKCNQKGVRMVFALSQGVDLSSSSTWRGSVQKKTSPQKGMSVESVMRLVTVQKRLVCIDSCASQVIIFEIARQSNLLREDRGKVIRSRFCSRFNLIAPTSSYTDRLRRQTFRTASSH